RRQSSGLRVLLAWMVSGKKAREIARERKARTVGKRIWRARGDQTLPLQQVQIRVESNTSQRQDGARSDPREFLFKVWQAVLDFFRQRLVGGRRAANGRRDQRVLQSQPVIGPLRLSLIGEPRPIQLFVQEISRPVARKHSPRSIGPVSGGREADDDQP